MREKILTSMTTPSMPGGTLSDESFTSFAFSPKMAVRSFSSGRELRLALRRDLADEDVARLHVRADADDAALVEIEQRFFRDVRNFTRDLFLAALGIANVQLELLDVDRRIDVVLHQSLGQHDGILEVVAVPRHERHGHVRAERELALLGRGAVGQHVAGLHLLALAHERTLVDRRVLVGSPVLLEAVAVVLREPRQRTIASPPLGFLRARPDRRRR